MRRRRPKGRTIYTIEYLLSKQPKMLQKDPRYAALQLSLEKSPELARKKFNRRCYSLLHNGIIRPEHLENFYRTYRIPSHPFFPLFFEIKRSYLQKRKQNKEERQRYISRGMNQLPPQVVDFMKALAQLEQTQRSTGKAVLFQQKLYPDSKKKIDQYLKFNHKQWIKFFDDFSHVLQQHYARISKTAMDNMQAAFILGCRVCLEGYPEGKEIKEKYRSLSKRYHPDAGGDPAMFIRIKWARDVLLG